MPFSVESGPRPDTRAGSDSTAEVRDSATHREVKPCYYCKVLITATFVIFFSQIPFFFLSLDEILGAAYHYYNIDFFYFSLLFYSKVNITESAVPLVQEAHPHLHRSQPRRGHGLSLAGWELAGQSIAQNFEKKILLLQVKRGRAWRSGARAWERLTGYAN